MTETGMDQTGGGDASTFDQDAYLERVRARDAFNALLGLEVVSAAPERAETRVRVTEAHLNFFGVCHGGLVFSVADAAFGIAANAGGRLAAMIDAHLTMTAPARPGDQLVAVSERVSESRRLAVYRVIVRKCGADGAPDAVVGAFTGTVYVRDGPPP